MELTHGNKAQVIVPASSTGNMLLGPNENKRYVRCGQLSGSADALLMLNGKFPMFHALFDEASWKVVGIP